MQPIDTTPIEKFMARARQMVVNRSKEMRLSAEEANDLVAAIAQVLARQTTLQERLIADLSEPIVVVANGGSFE